MRIPTSGIFISLAAVAKWFQPSAFLAIVLASGLTIALVFLVAIQWMTRIGVL